MDGMNSHSTEQRHTHVELPRWYFLTILVLLILSLITLDRTAEGRWEISLGIREITPILVVLGILPFLLRFLLEIPKGMKMAAKMPGVEIMVERVQEIDAMLEVNQEKHLKAGEAVKDASINEGEIEMVKAHADETLEQKVSPAELSYIQQTYLQKLNELVQDLNRNRHEREGKVDNLAEAGEIAYKMRSMAPLLFGQIDIQHWLVGPNLGKQLAAIKYLDWSKEIEYARDLAARLPGLEKRGDSFQAFHTLVTLLSMADQLAFDYREEVLALIQSYQPEKKGITEREFVKTRILERLVVEKKLQAE